MPLINCEINIILTWSKICVISNAPANQATKFAGTKLYVPVVNLLTDDNDYTTGCLIDYNNFIKPYKMIAIDLSKQQGLDADPKAIQQINFTGNLLLKK